jgi:hypothetical protein
MNYGTASTGTTGLVIPLDVAAIDKMLKAMADVVPEPIGEWMRSKGFPPESSLLILPYAMAEGFLFPPQYVRFSRLVSSPVLCQDHGLVKTPPRSAPIVPQSP